MPRTHSSTEATTKLAITVRINYIKNLESSKILIKPRECILKVESDTF